MNPQARHLAMSFEAVQPRDRLRVQQLPVHRRATLHSKIIPDDRTPAGRNTDPEPTSYSGDVLADAQQRYDDVIGDFPV
jgi:hypothetical protein